MNHNKVVGIIQARLSSSRLPKKVLLPLGNNNNLVIDHVYQRLNLCRHVDSIYIATSEDKSDDELVQYCKKKQYNIFRGSLNNVLSRFSEIAKVSQASHIVRITADCPLIDPSIIDTCIIGCIAENYDLYSLSGNFPDGLDVQVFSSKSLLDADFNATKDSEKEHVGPYIENNPEKFSIGQLKLFYKSESLRLTLDEEDDYKLLSNIYDNLDTEDKNFGIQNVIHYLNHNPHLKKINSHIIRNEGYLESLSREK